MLKLSVKLITSVVNVINNRKLRNIKIVVGQ